jgi:hypothetical protein
MNLRPPCSERRREEVMCQVVVDLSTIAAAVDGVSATSTPTMELLEAGRAIQTALVLLSDWGIA